MYVYVVWLISYKLSGLNFILVMIVNNFQNVVLSTGSAIIILSFKLLNQEKSCHYDLCDLRVLQLIRSRLSNRTGLKNEIS